MTNKQLVLYLMSMRNIDNLSSKYIVSYVTGKNVLSTFEVTASDIRNALKYAKIVSRGVPVQYATHYAYFYKSPFYVSSSVLIPRGDSERLVEEALKYVDSSSKVLDLCCGSGCLGLSILKEKNCDMTLADISSPALRVAKKNAKTLGLTPTIIRSDMLSSVGIYSIIVCNPPYIKYSAKLDPIVLKEPSLALYGGEDGLDYYRILADNVISHLTENGVLIVEIGDNMENDVLEIFSNIFKNYKLVQDYTPKVRAIVFSNGEIL